MRAPFVKFAFALTLASQWLAAEAVAAEVLRVGGTGSATATLERIGSDFLNATGIKIEVVPSLGSSGGIRAVADGVLDVAVSARPLSHKEAAERLSEVPVARTPFGFVTSNLRPNGLKGDDIAAIYRSEDPRWADGTPIHVILRPRSEADSLFLASYFPGMGAALEAARRRPDLPVAANDQDNAQMAEALAGSLTASSLTQVKMEKRNLRFVAIDGVEPTLENLESGAYPYARTLFLVFPGKRSAAAERFLEFLRSPQGKKLLRETGSLPAES
jgi:phosphate transport system substrate-binding protein